MGDEIWTPERRAEDLRKLRETAQRMEDEARKLPDWKRGNIVFSPPAGQPPLPKK